MSKPTPKYLINILLAFVTITAGCMPQPEPLNTPLPTSNSHTTVPTAVPSPTETNTPQTPKLQLTYQSGSSVYGLDMECLDSVEPCFGEPKLLFTEGDGFLGTFFWSPDGQRVAYEYDFDVFISDWDGENKVQISSSPDYDGWPIWMPDGQHIVYQTKDENYYLIFVKSSLDGSNQVVLMTERELDARGNLSSPGRLSWSPDERKIAFEANPRGAKDWTLYQIFMHDLETGGFEQITDADADNLTPFFSPDGEWIIFTRDNIKHTSKGSLLVKISALTHDETIVYQTDTSSEWFWFPQWSPIGNWISFSMGGDIYIIRPDGTQLINVTQSLDITENIAAWRLVPIP